MTIVLVCRLLPVVNVGDANRCITQALHVPPADVSLLAKRIAAFFVYLVGGEPWQESVYEAIPGEESEESEESEEGEESEESKE
jgi:hypothetical protein